MLQKNKTITVSYIRVDFTHCVYKCASANVIHNFVYKSKAYIVITDPGIYLATTKTVYID